MSMSENEERFRSPTPSLHQIFTATGRPNRGRQWARRLWVAAALVGVMTMSCTVTSHYTVQSEIHGSRLHTFHTNSGFFPEGSREAALRQRMTTQETRSPRPEFLMAATESNTDSCPRPQGALSRRCGQVYLHRVDRHPIHAVAALWWWRKSCLTGAAPIHLWTSCLGILRCDSLCDAMA